MLTKQIKLSNMATAALGFSLGFKPSYRRTEAERYGFDFDEALAKLRTELSPLSVIVTKRNRHVLSEIFEANTSVGQLGSQTHQYMNQLGFSTELDRMFNNPMEQLDALSIR